MKSKMLIPLCILILSACNNSDNLPGQTSEAAKDVVAPRAPEEIAQETQANDDTEKAEVESAEVESAEDVQDKKVPAVFDQASFEAKLALIPLEEPLFFSNVVCTPSKNITYRNFEMVYHGDGIFELTMRFVAIDLKLNMSLMQDQLVMISTDTQSSVLLKNLAAQGTWSIKDATESSLVLSVEATETSCELTFEVPAD